MPVWRSVALLVLVLAGAAGGHVNIPLARSIGMAAPTYVGCPIFPASNVWNRDISRLPVAAHSAALLASIGLDSGLHPDFSNNGGYGIPVTVVTDVVRPVRVRFAYASESDPGPYPIPTHPLIEAASDAHMILVDRSTCHLYELWDSQRTSHGWTAGSGAIWNLRSNALRPDSWTSADAAGLPIFPGLVRYSEVAAGLIAHALRFTAPRTCSCHIFPARHDAGDGVSAALPPMGLRVRLKSAVDISWAGPQAKVLLTALKRYGMILADNGSPWYISGVPDTRWNDDDLHQINRITGADFEVVNTAGLTMR